MKIINNVTETVKDNLIVSIKNNSKIAIAASCFSIYAFQELKKQLTNIEELRFIFTSPAFTMEKAKKEKREFYIPRLNREKSLYGTEFEVKLRNELSQKAIAKECTDWIRRKVTFKSNVTDDNMCGFINVDNKHDKLTYMPITGFTTVDIGCEKGNNAYNMVNEFEAPYSDAYFKLFDEVWNDKNKLQDVTDEVIESITTAYRENSADFIYYVTLYNIFNEFLEDISEDVLPNEATGFKESVVWNKLYNFQKDAVLAIINKLEKFNGCILADSVGLGKTFTSVAVIKYYENRNKSVLVLCPKKLSDNWNTYNHNFTNNPLEKDRLRYDVLYHTDLSRTGGYSNGIQLDRINWGNYDLVVIDESHNFRNGGETYDDNGEKNDRYSRLMNRVICKGVKTKVLMLSATPVNTKFKDLKCQLALAYEGDQKLINDKLNTTRPIEDIFKRAQTSFNQWSKLDVKDRTTDKLLKMLDFDFFEVLDSVTIARSRKQIQTYYDTTDIGTFPTRLPPIAKRCGLTHAGNTITYNEIFAKLTQLELSIYNPSKYILQSKINVYEEKYGNDRGYTFLSQANREIGIKVLMGKNLLKRLESSVYSFTLTIDRIIKLIESTIMTIDNYNPDKEIEVDDMGLSKDLDYDDQEADSLTVGKKVKIKLCDLDYLSWKRELQSDLNILFDLYCELKYITPDKDDKLNELYSIIRNKMNNPINDNNKKVIIFSAFSDTVCYLYDNVSQMVKSEFGLVTAMVTGGIDGRTTIPNMKCDLNTVLTCFSPISKEKDIVMPNQPASIDILIATDCISEGQNLQDCDYLINYDIHWNPVRIIQRFGRIDRIGSKNKDIQLVNFWPDITLDEYLQVKDRVESRMKITAATSTGDNPIDLADDGELEYRKQQLERLQNEVVDMEDMSGGVSIMDLGLNDFRMDLLSYIKDNPNLDKTPYGMHAVTQSGKLGTPKGVIYILKNINENVNINSQNRLHPFYMVYISDESEIVSNHLEPKKTLDILRSICKNQTEPNMELCKVFNAETTDGKKMNKYSDLLEDAINSIIDVKEESDLDSLFSPGGTTALLSNVTGLDDFELICFIVVK